MKKIYWFGMVFICVMAILLGYIWLIFPDLGRAQVRIANSNSRSELDKETHKQRVERALMEAKKIQDDIIQIMAEKKPEYKLINKRNKPLNPGSDGPNGSTNSEMSWQKGKQQNFRMEIMLALHKKGLSEQFWRGLNFISMGDFFKVEGIGDEAILVKNVYANTSMTNVGLHFIKGRANVQTYLRNYKETTANNEKELRELVSLIEPLIVARDNFDD